MRPIVLLSAMLVASSIMASESPAAVAPQAVAGEAAPVVPASTETAAVGHTDIDLAAGTLRLPYTLRTISRGETIQRDGFTDIFEMVIQGGELDGQRLQVLARYIRPEHGEEVSWQAVVQERVELIAVNGSAPIVAPVRIGGFDFFVLDYRPDQTSLQSVAVGGVDKKMESQGIGLDRSVELLGTINGALLRLAIGVPGDFAGREALREALAAWTPEVAGMLRSARGYDERREAIIKDTTVTFPAARVEFERGTEIILGNDWVMRDTESTPVGRARLVYMNRIGFWTWQNFGMRMSCRKNEFLDEDYQQQIAEWPKPVAGDRPATAQPVQPMQLGGVDGKMYRARVNADSGTLHALMWIGEKEGVSYSVEVTRTASAGAERRILKQLSEQTFTCDLDAT